MRPQKIMDKEMLNGLSKVFKSKGYEAASLNELAQITGLKKASLYHRFPKGKQGMAAAVLLDIEKWVTQNIFDVLNGDEEGLPEVRLKKALSSIEKLYDGGSEPCIFRAFSMQSALNLFEKNINDGMTSWVNAFTSIGIALQQSPDTARELALEVIIEIQGSLIVTKCMNDTTIFKNALIKIEKKYLAT
ncbi:TetR/AcrR family transcriptional regulator [Maribacter sp. MAR_2009_72]|uniref:TetR/AcrR family transcriptional regulator n=1 Tax=Maribacter sp. MAR_2009_72 TaxID=1250050 RepID=UPI00119C260B|nr:TetR/AcrR family transcriptional regulator [Maribacter sp. MAR_2009_72]TVZ14604.1 TetR family transcriptional regulator [Maribacter sp. MAR_2009_72]